MKFHVISTISHELLGKIAKGSHDTQEVSDRTGVDEQDIVGIVESLVRADMAMTEEDHLAIQKATQEAEAAQKKKMEVQPKIDQHLRDREAVAGELSRIGQLIAIKTSHVKDLTVRLDFAIKEGDQEAKKSIASQIKDANAALKALQEEENAPKAKYEALTKALADLGYKETATAAVEGEKVVK